MPALLSIINKLEITLQDIPHYVDKPSSLLCKQGAFLWILVVCNKFQGIVTIRLTPL